MDNKQLKMHDGLVLCLMVVFVLFRMPVVTYYVNMFVFMGALALLLILLITRGRLQKDAGSRFFAASFLYLLLSFLNELFVEDQIVYLLWDVFLAYLPLVVGFFLIHHRMNQTASVTVGLIMAAYLITCITTYLSLQQYPGASRDLASGTNPGLIYNKLNIGGFDFIYSLAITHPVFVYFLRKTNHMFLSIVTTAIFALCVVESQYTIALLIFALSLVAYLLPVKDEGRPQKQVLWKIALLLLAIFVLAPEILSYLSKQEFLENYADKLTDITKMLRGENVQMDNTVTRQEVYAKSWESFLKYPIFGGQWVEEMPYGGHSFFLDTMAKWGVVGLAAVLVVLGALVKWYKQLFGQSNAYYFVLLCLGLSLVVSALNPVFWAFELGVVIPVFTYNALGHADPEGKPKERHIQFVWRR